MRWNAKPSRRDANEPDIVRDLVADGFSVQRLAGTDGEVDLLIGREGLDMLVEIKVEKAGKRLTLAQVAHGGEFSGMDRRLGEKQARWIQRWRGAEPFLADNSRDIIAEHERRAHARAGQRRAG